jgi:hypothetical protein
MMTYEVDAIHLTERGEHETRLSQPYSLYGWDCECVLIMNPKGIRYQDLATGRDDLNRLYSDLEKISCTDVEEGDTVELVNIVDLPKDMIPRCPRPWLGKVGGIWNDKSIFVQWFDDATLFSGSGRSANAGYNKDRLMVREKKR